MIIRAIEKPFDMILEARNMLFKRIKTLLLFFGLNNGLFKREFYQ